MTSATPDLSLLSQSLSITALWLVPNYRVVQKKNGTKFMAQHSDTGLCYVSSLFLNILLKTTHLCDI